MTEPTCLRNADGFLFDPDRLEERASAADGAFQTGRHGVERIFTPADGKVDFICMDDGRVWASVNSAMGCPALYPMPPARIETPVEAVLMDLDGTSVRSEEFWIWIIEQTIARLLDNSKFTLEEADLPHVSGHSVSEHLQHCIKKYCPDRALEEARNHYFDLTRREMKAILDGTGRTDAFQPVEGLKDFLLTLKARNVRIGLVTSGLHEKAWPEIWAAFKQLDLGDPRHFYDAIITAGFALGQGEPGTLGELEPKPHPWLYAETARVGLGIESDARARVVGMEDSGAGVVSIRLAGFACLGMADGNIPASGTLGLCSHYCANFDDALKRILP